jgi:hypothetical protein
MFLLLLKGGHHQINTYQKVGKETPQKNANVWDIASEQETADKLIVQLFKVNGLRFSLLSLN